MTYWGISALIGEEGLSFFVDGPGQVVEVVLEEVDDLVDYLAVLVDLGTLVGDVVAVVAAVGLHELVLRLRVVVLVELARLGHQVVLSLILLLPDLPHLLQRGLDHRHLLPQRVDLDHVLEVVPKAVVVLLVEFAVHAHLVKVELDVLLVQTEELLLDLLLVRLLLRLLLQDLQDLLLVRIVLQDPHLVIGTQPVHTLVVEVRSHQVPTVVLAHS